MELSEFTPRQRDVLVEMCKGKVNKEIANTLGMAESTVKLHLTEIFKTLGVRNRMQAIIKASDLPITTEEPLPPITDLQILEYFTNNAFDTIGNTWSDRVLSFGHAIDDRHNRQAILR